MEEGPRGEFIELSEEALNDMFKFIIDPEAEVEVPTECAFSEPLYGEEFYRDRFPGFSDEAYGAMVRGDQ